MPKFLIEEKSGYCENILPQQEYLMKSSAHKKIDTSKAPKAIGPYSQAILAGQFLFVSGQLGIDPATGQLVGPDIRLQVIRVLDNLEAILKAGGCSLREVVRCDVFLKNMQDFAIVNEEYAKRFNHPTPPARQTIEVSQLPLNGLVEISCIAII